MAIRFLKLDFKPSKRQIAKYSELVHRSVDFILGSSKHSEI